jgi:hypothetical protein
LQNFHLIWYYEVLHPEAGRCAVPAARQDLKDALADIPAGTGLIEGGTEIKHTKPLRFKPATPAEV